MARREQLDVWTGVESARGAFEVVELSNDLIDPRPNPEELLILREEEAQRDELWQRIQAAVKDPRHFQALYLFHGEEKSLKEIAAQFGTTVREIRHWKDTAMHQIRVALGIETEEKRKALNKRRRARRVNRQAESKGIRPNTEPPSPLGLGLSHP
jgi:DNA-directed RNA polymerase specialized sigma24 family protein